jgi:hypothetical protein
MRIARVQCDALLQGCETETELDNADDWFLDAPNRKGGFYACLYAWGYEDVCPKCADKLALESEHEATA